MSTQQIKSRSNVTSRRGLPLLLPAGVTALLLAYGCRTTATEPRPPPKPTPPLECRADGALAGIGKCADQLTTCQLICKNGIAKCFDCPEDRAPVDGGAQDSSSTSSKEICTPERFGNPATSSGANLCCRYLLGEPALTRSGVAQPFNYNAKRDYKNDTRPGCADKVGPDGPDGVTMFVAPERGRYLVKINSAQRCAEGIPPANCDGEISVYFRVACANSGPVSSAVCAKGPCTGNSEPSCETVCLAEQEIDCRNNVMDGDTTPSPIVAAGTRLLIGWNQSDPFAGEVQLEIKFVAEP